ncbi:MAG: hypothetical protein EOP84_07160 [Verrucomicrobiaceae bacterium]|nr:MAG: hypothetical protein EOP84_07160 [Verrucomicrobiaceae bacterium]
MVLRSEPRWIIDKPRLKGGPPTGETTYFRLANIHHPRDPHEIEPTIRWCEQQFGECWHNDYYFDKQRWTHCHDYGFSFRKADDALAFKLRWC